MGSGSQEEMGTSPSKFAVLGRETPCKIIKPSLCFFILKHLNRDMHFEKKKDTSVITPYWKPSYLFTHRRMDQQGD